MIDVRVSRRVPYAAEAVAEYMFDVRNDPTWIGGLRSVDLPTGPVRTGTRVRRVAAFMGRRIDYELEVERIEPARRMEMRSVRAPFPMEVTYEVEPHGEAADVAIRVRGGPGGIARLAHPVMARQVRHSLSGDLKRLEARLRERRSRPAGSER